MRPSLRAQPLIALPLAVLTASLAVADPPNLPLESIGTGGAGLHLPDTSISLGDIDGDGRLDVVYPSGYTENLGYQSGDGFGGFGPRVDVSMDGNIFSGPVLFDADLDGDLDIGVGTFDPAFGRRLNDGVGGFSQLLVVPVPITLRPAQAADMSHSQRSRALGTIAELRYRSPQEWWRTARWRAATKPWS